MNGGTFIACMLALLLGLSASGGCAPPEDGPAPDPSPPASMVTTRTSELQASQTEATALLNLLSALLGAAAPSAPVFEPAALKAATQAGAGLPIDRALPAIQAELQRRYPGRILPALRWRFQLSGGTMGQLALLYGSPREYLLFYGSPIGTEGFSGRSDMEIWNFMIQGRLQAYEDGELLHREYRAGDVAYLGRNKGRGWRLTDAA